MNSRDSLARGVAPSPPRTLHARSLAGSIRVAPQTGRTIRFGRENRPSVDLSVGEDDLRVSRRHGELIYRQDRWWLQPLLTAVALVLFIVYATFRAFQNDHYFAEPYISPFYSPCLTTACEGDTFPELFTGPAWISPALYILIFPLGIRMTCYYYRKAYYRSFWLSPPACAVAEPHRRYTGETRLPLLGQNLHRYFFYLGLLFNVVLTYDAVLAFRDETGAWGHMGLGTLVLLANAALLWLYSLSCHSCRHIVGGRLNSFSRHPLRYRFWTLVSKLNAKHMSYAWISLFGVAFADFYVFLLVTGTIPDLRFF